MMKQLKLFKDPNLKQFGSDLNLGIRKEQRPISLKTPMHLILKSDVVMDHGGFKKIETKIYKEIHFFAERFGIKIFNLAIHCNHIHLLILTATRQAYISFIRALNGTMIRKLKLPQGLFTKSPYTRIVGWGRDFETVNTYINKNRFEAEGKTHYFEALQSEKNRR